jgi:hypothetical protein
MILTGGKRKTTTGTKRRNNRGELGKALCTEQRQLIPGERRIAGKAVGREKQILYTIKDKHSVYRKRRIRLGCKGQSKEKIQMPITHSLYLTP